MTTPTYNEALTALDAAVALSKIGSKNGAILKRLAQVLRWCRAAREKFVTRQELELASRAEHDANGEIKVKVNDKNEQSAVIPNELAFTTAINAILRETVETEQQTPRPFTWAEICEFKWEEPESDVVERLGPFVSLDD